MTTTPSTIVAVPRALLERAINILNHEMYEETARMLNFYLNPNPEGGVKCASPIATSASALNRGNAETEPAPSAENPCASKGASGVPSTTGPDLPTGVAGEGKCNCADWGMMDHLPSCPAYTTATRPMSPEFQARVLANPAGPLKRQLEDWRDLISAPRDGTWIEIEFLEVGIQTVQWVTIYGGSWITKHRSYLNGPRRWRPIVLNPPTKS